MTIQLNLFFVGPTDVGQIKCLRLLQISELESKPTISYKGKAVPLQTWSGPEVSRKLRLPNFMKTAQDGGKVISLTHRPPLPQEIHLVLISARGTTSYR
jgi:hypothetical protein